MVIRKNNVFTRRTDGSTVTVTDVNNGMITFDDGSRIKSSSLDYAYIFTGRGNGECEVEMLNGRLFIDGQPVQMGSLSDAKLLYHKGNTVAITVAGKENPEKIDVMLYDIQDDSFKKIHHNWDSAKVLVDKECNVTYLLSKKTVHSVVDDDGNGTHEVTGYRQKLIVRDATGTEVSKNDSDEKMHLFDGDVTSISVELDEGRIRKTDHIFLSHGLKLCTDVRNEPFFVISDSSNVVFVLHQERYEHPSDSEDGTPDVHYDFDGYSTAYPANLLGELDDVTSLYDGTGLMFTFEKGLAFYDYYHTLRTFLGEKVLDAAEGKSLVNVNIGFKQNTLFLASQKDGETLITEISVYANTDRGYVTEIIEH